MGQTVVPTTFDETQSFILHLKCSPSENNSRPEQEAKVNLHTYTSIPPAIHHHIFSLLLRQIVFIHFQPFPYEITDLDLVIEMER